MLVGLLSKILLLNKQNQPLMKKAYLFCFFLSLFSFSLTAQQILRLDWQRNFGGALDDEAYNIIEAKDGGYLICGSTLSSGAGKMDAVVIRITSTGEKLWEQTYGGTQNDRALNIIAANDGGYYVCGGTQSLGKGGWDMWLFKINDDGRMLWQKTFGDEGDEEAAHVIISPDNKFVLAGYTTSRGAGKTDFYIYKTDTTSKPMWRRTIGGAKQDDLKYIEQQADSSFLIVGSSKSFTNGASDLFFCRIDFTGRIKMKKNFGGKNYDYGNYFVATPDNGYLIAGGSMTNSKGYFDFYLFKINLFMEDDWGKLYGDSKNEIAEVILPYQGGYIMVGNSQSNSEGGYDMWVVKVNQKGIQEWENNFGGVKDDMMTKIIPASEGGFIACGNTQSTTNGKKDIWVIKLK